MDYNFVYRMGKRFPWFGNWGANGNEGDVMPAVVQARCPHCQNVLRIPAEWVAQPMRCKFCHNIFQAKGAAPTAAPAAPAVAPSRQYAAAAPVAQPAAPVSRDPFAFQQPVIHLPQSVPTQPRTRTGGSGSWWTGVLLGFSVLRLAAIGIVALGPQISGLFLKTPTEANAPKDDKDNSFAKTGDKGPSRPRAIRNPPPKIGPRWKPRRSRIRNSTT